MIAFCQLPAICVAHQWDVVMFPLIFGTSMCFTRITPSNMLDELKPSPLESLDSSTEVQDMFPDATLDPGRTRILSKGPDPKLSPMLIK